MRSESVKSSTATISDPESTPIGRPRLIRKMQTGAQVVFHRSWINELPLILGIVAVTILCLFIAIRLPWTNVAVSLAPLWNDAEVSVAPLMFIPISLLCLLIHRLWDDKYVITNEHLVAITGLLSLKVIQSRVHFAHIRGIEVEQGLLQRILNTGNILVGTAAQAEQEVIIVGVRKPAYYREIFERMVNRSVEAAKSEHVGSLND